MNAKSGPARPLLVLIIEDNPDTAESLARFLRLGCGHSVTVVHDGLSGSQVAFADRPDVVVCDLGLPKRNGLFVGEEISSALDPRPLLIAVTGYSDTTYRELARAAGFDHFPAKPADPFEIESLIGDHFFPQTVSASEVGCGP